MTAAARTAFLNRSAPVLEALHPATIRIGASTTDITCATGGLKRANELVSGGFMHDDDIAFRILRTNLDTIPTAGTLVKVMAPAALATRVFRIDTVTDEPSDVSIRLACKSLTS